MAPERTLKAVFALSSGRSGTRFLSEVIRQNATNCVCRHETYGLNPSLFGRPIYDLAVGERTRARALVARKRRVVERYGAGTYVETSHAFLKSWFDLAEEFFPERRYVHLVRDPLEVAKSEAYRERLIKRWRLPFCHYRGGDGQRHFLWSLTGREPIFASFAARPLTRLQWYLLQWIEIENRAQRALQHIGPDTCFVLLSPGELNDPARLSELFDFLGLKPRQSPLLIRGQKNRNWRPTVINEQDRLEFQEVLEQLPPEHLWIFRGQPYASLPEDSFRRLAAACNPHARNNP